jgi:hypothetical protein
MAPRRLRGRQLADVNCLRKADPFAACLLDVHLLR